tara:strand:- start:2 stop:253 length:252 start_codon:yes stop_codon:yes gene_type:complete
MPRRIKHNNLLPWFLEDHGQLPERYVRACEKFFKSLKLQARKDIINEENERLYKPQASSSKPQASSLTAQSTGDTSRIIKEKL